MFKQTTVRMSRDYLKAWDTFDRGCESIKPRLLKLIRNSKDDLEGQLHGLHALSAIKVHGGSLRKQMCQNIESLLDGGKEAPV